MKAERGFTLIEVMVAVIIVSIALPALLLQMGNMATQTAYSRETAVAHWVAENKLQEIKLTKQMQRQVPTGRQADDLDMAGYTWDWSTETKEVDTQIFGKILQVRVDVRMQGQENVLASLTAYFVDGT